MVEWITQDTFLEQRVHPSVLMHSLERREQGYFCRFVYARRRRSRINLSLDILLPGILERVKGFRFRDNSLLKSLIHHENFEQVLTENRGFERYSSILLKLEGD